MKKISLSTAKKRAWKSFSLWVRHRGASGDTNTCVTCGKRYPVTGKGCLQASHFVPGRGNSILFDERGCYPGCYICNVVKKGNMIPYYKFMLKEHGQDVIDELEKLSHQSRKYTVTELLDIEAQYKQKLSEIANNQAL
jgi:hypothetical protein